MHLDLDDAVALAGLAASALHVEGEASRLIAARLGFREGREPFPDRREGAGVGRRIRARRAPDRRLVDVDDLVEMFETIDARMRRRMFERAVEPPRGGFVKRIDDEGRFAAAGDAGDAGENPERDRGRDIFEIIAARADDGELAARVGPAPAARRRDFKRAGEILAGQRILVRHDFGGRALRHDLAAVNARARAEIDDMIGGKNGVLVMFDNNDRIAEIAQPPQGVEKPRIVALMQADRGFVQHIKHAGEARADLRGEPDALALAAGERAGSAGKRQIVEPDIDEKREPVGKLFQDALRDLAPFWIELVGQRLEPLWAARTESAVNSPMWSRRS